MTRRTATDSPALGRYRDARELLRRHGGQRTSNYLSKSETPAPADVIVGMKLERFAFSCQSRGSSAKWRIPPLSEGSLLKDYGATWIKGWDRFGFPSR
jgi:hypothetical protein